ncbi:hypothetical protein OGAPHI_005252 [Ogataea philodendri]|uniref:Secreted protein n=1 Tax=Ogataea philodendri TaxID=1378263 RepID=A0A9P8P2G4_9ASCO|nr:uncharacterized protein OGAPHI_005252 [Ogataea philodendri]KAH3663849.1 hypothetical protein OGAPHI_005252 [Ogataea philodendri]
MTSLEVLAGFFWRAMFFVIEANWCARVDFDAVFTGGSSSDTSSLSTSKILDLEPGRTSFFNGDGCNDLGDFDTDCSCEDAGEPLTEAFLRTLGLIGDPIWVAALIISSASSESLLSWSSSLDEISSILKLPFGLAGLDLGLFVGVCA